MLCLENDRRFRRVPRSARITGPPDPPKGRAFNTEYDALWHALVAAVDKDGDSTSPSTTTWTEGPTARSSEPAPRRPERERHPPQQ
ncbi:hypothetical protein [Nonomuraea rhizosphaerae]|uniref:hypothetical protein n=1 Tax=Nonomuraea rhizosphaerae TaxID=2665663 RepID=UPI001C5EE693|nr:hypothetical protein [Nonomuraea rhizosphaerae]